VPPTAFAAAHLLPGAARDASAHNLPTHLTSFVGRGQEVREARRLLASARLLTLTGAGGVGKTRLALAAAAGLVDQYRDGVWLLVLAPLADPALIPTVVAQTLGLREESQRPLLTTLIDRLKDRQLLLVLDNFEHLVAACAELVGDLLRACPDLQILATSREVLGCGESSTTACPP
jgi:non-specific serine/threonine protein kinase